MSVVDLAADSTTGDFVVYDSLTFRAKCTFMITGTNRMPAFTMKTSTVTGSYYFQWLEYTNEDAATG